MSNGRSYENNLKLLLIRQADLSLDEAMVAYDWFGYYRTQLDDKKAFELTRSRVLREGGLDELPSRPFSATRIAKRRIRSWFS